SRLLAGQGAKVTIVDLHDEKGKRLADEIGAGFAHADVTDTDQHPAAGAGAAPADVTHPDQAQAAVEQANADDDLRILANCAGIGWAQRTVGKGGEPADLGAFEKVVQINLIGTFNVTRLAASGMG